MEIGDRSVLLVRPLAALAVERDPGGQPDLFELHPVPVLEEPASAAVVGDVDIEP